MQYRRTHGRLGRRLAPTSVSCQRTQKVR